MKAERVTCVLSKHAQIQGGGGGGQVEKSQKYGVSYQYLSGSPKNHKDIKPAFNVGPLSARQQKTRKKKKTCQSWTPSDITFWIGAR